MADIKNKVIEEVISLIAVGQDLKALDADRQDALKNAVERLQVLDSILDVEKSEAVDTIRELKDRLADAVDAKADDSKKPIAEVDGEKYEVNFTPHGFADRQALIADQDALKAILKKDGQTCLTKI